MDRRLLQKELVSLGKTLEPLEPKVCADDYPELFGSPAVLVSAGHDASLDQLKRHACHTLARLISSLPTTDDLKLVGEAMFGLGEFKSMLIGARQDKLREKYGISLDKYKARRPRVLRALLFGLSLADDSLSPPAVLPNSHEHRNSLTQTSSEQLAEDAAHLHFAGLLVMFYGELQGKAGLPDRAMSPRWNTIQVDPVEWLFREWAQIAGERYSAFRRTTLTKELAQTTLQEVNDVLAPDCFTPGLIITEEDEDTLQFYSDGLIIGEDEDMLKLLQATWRPWFDENRPGAASMIACGKIVVDTLASVANFRAPIVTNARARAHKTLAYSYGGDETAPLFDGKSLRNTLDAYFDTMGPRLVQRNVLGDK